MGDIWSISYTPSVAGTFVFTATATNAAGNVATASATVTVAKGTPEITAPTGLTGEVGKTLGDVTFGDARFAWAATEDTTTPFAATGTVTAAWTYTPDDTANWNTVDGTSEVEVGKATPEFVALTGLTGTYGTTLALADVALPEGYAWSDDTTAIAAAGTASYPATSLPRIPRHHRRYVWQSVPPKYAHLFRTANGRKCANLLDKNGRSRIPKQTKKPRKYGVFEGWALLDSNQ